MAGPKAAVRFTANFEANLASIEAFWQERQAYALLLETLQQTVIGNLEQHPRLGRGFFARLPQSLEVPAHVASLQQRLENIDLREYLVGNYLILHGMDGGAGAVSRPMSVTCLRFATTCNSRLTSRGSRIQARRTPNEHSQSLAGLVMTLLDGLCILTLISEGSR